MSLVLGVLGALLLWYARRSGSDGLPRNWVSGYRTSATLRSDAAWYAGQRAGAPLLRIAGIVSLAGAAVAWIVSPHDERVGMAAFCIVLVILLVGAARADQAARQVPDD